MAKIDQQVEQKLLEYVNSSQNTPSKEILQAGTDLLPILEKHLSTELPINTLERFETVLKELLLTLMTPDISGQTARQIASFQQKLGLLPKYKSYTVKNASPMGFSIFLHNLGEGFSYQRHIIHKTEVFHILKVFKGGYVFLCDYPKWLTFYKKGSFERWLEGEANPEYEKYRFFPKEGDIFPMDKLNTVHTVIGCFLEEFATVSTDMVDRLYDQNASKSIPPHFNRAYSKKHLKNLKLPLSHRLVTQDKNGQWQTKILKPQKIEGGESVELANIEFRASQIAIEPNQSSALYKDDLSTTTIYIHEGEGEIVIADQTELSSSKLPAIPVKAGDVLLIPTFINYQYISKKGSLKLTEHKIPLKVAFATTTDQSTYL